ncbi:hypothetical protein [Streptomyces sp. SD15]
MGRHGGCVLNGCLTVLVGILVLVCGAVVWVMTAPGRYEDQARDRMKDSVDESKQRLSLAAADGTLLGTEIARSVRSTGKAMPPDVRRNGRHITVTTEFMGLGPGLFGATSVTGCYRFELVARSVSVEQIPGKRCFDLPRYRYRKPSVVAADVVAELRPVLAQGGLAAVPGAEVWQTTELKVEDSEVTHSQLTYLVWIRGAMATSTCYEFHATEKSRTLTARELKPEGCYGLQRAREAAVTAAERTELEASALKIEHRLAGALTDGTLTDGERRRAFALPKTDAMGQPAPGRPVAVAVSTERSPSEVIIVAKVNALSDTSSALGCYQFRAHLTTQSVTRRAAGTDCLLQRTQ